jgi:hypothetical protein
VKSTFVGTTDTNCCIRSVETAGVANKYSEIPLDRESIIPNRGRTRAIMAPDRLRTINIVGGIRKE